MKWGRVMADSSSDTMDIKTGWAFPPRFSLDAGVAMVDGDDELEQALRILFLTDRGERIMRPDFGCGLGEFLFENIRADLEAQIVVEVKRCILRYEPRVTLLAVDVAQATTPGTLNVYVQFQRRADSAAKTVSIALDVADGRGVAAS